jgi:protein-disulfide isomerase
MRCRRIVSALVAACVLASLGCRSRHGADDRRGEASEERSNETAVRPVIDDDVERFHVPLSGDEPQDGPDDALVTIVELSDFECPYCAKAAPTMRQLKASYGDDIRIVWMNNPLPFHKNAKSAATVALEAHAQQGDKGFWTMHDGLFANQRALDWENLEAMGAEQGLDVDALAKAIAKDKYAETIAREQAIAMALDARGTPAFFINGRSLAGAQPLTRFALLIDEELRRAKALVDAGIPKSELYEALIKNGIRKVEPTPPAPTPGAPAPTPSRVYDIPVPDQARAKGPKDADVVIQEFTDFQCPVCRRVTPTLDRVLQEYGSKVRIVFRDYPLDFHPDAHLSAEAAREVFAQQGNRAFWRYHDILLQNQHALSRSDLENYARRVGGMDMKRFRHALDSGKHKAAVDADIAAVAKAGARIGTPAFFFNGKLSIQGAYPFETFKAAIDAELQ